MFQPETPFQGCKTQVCLRGARSTDFLTQANFARQLGAVKSRLITSTSQVSISHQITLTDIK